VDALPGNAWGSLALAVLATAHWVDFTKSTFSWSDYEDLNKIHVMYGNTSWWSRLPWRLAHLTVSAGAAYVLALGWQEVFGAGDDPAATPVIVPVGWGF
jgi:hypothetical protein